MHYFQLSVKMSVGQKHYYCDDQRTLIKRAYKVVPPAFGCAQHPKAGWNTQQIR